MKKIILFLLLSVSSVDAGIIGKTPVFIKHPLYGFNKKKAENFKVGESVLSSIDVNGNIKPISIKIQNIEKHQTNRIVFIRTEHGQLIVDPEERFFSFNRLKWIKAKYLNRYDTLTTLQGREVRLKEIAYLNLLVPVDIYNFTLEACPVLYIADSSGESLLIHNEPVTLMSLYLASLPVKISLISSTTIPTILGFLWTFTAPAVVAVHCFAIGRGIGWAAKKAYHGITSFFHHRRRKKELRRVIKETYPEISSPPALVRNTQDIVEKLKKIDDRIAKIKDIQKPSGGKDPDPKDEERKLQEINYKYSHRNSRQLRKGHKSSFKRLNEHVDKLKKYIENPDKYDDRGLLTNASEEQRVTIINTRVNHLIKEINNFTNECEEIQNALEYLNETL